MKFYGPIGFTETVETSPGVWKEVLVPHNYYGDVVRNSRRYESSSDKLNDNLNITNQFSIVADAYAYQNFHKMRYVEWMGAKWKITSVDATNRPRLILEVGGVYNEEQT